MVYLDTNILIYATIEQDIEKKEKSLDIIEDLVNRLHFRQNHPVP
jgi:predicted nucleic acid-binding protein